jgi:hypothetical protein
VWLECLAPNAQGATVLGSIQHPPTQWNLGVMTDEAVLNIVHKKRQTGGKNHLHGIYLFINTIHTQSWQ